MQEAEAAAVEAVEATAEAHAEAHAEGYIDGDADTDAGSFMALWQIPRGRSSHHRRTLSRPWMGRRRRTRG